MGQHANSIPDLVTAASDVSPLEPPLTAELAFLVDGSRRWNLRLDVQGQDCTDALAHAVAAAPQALEWHLRRIHHAYGLRQGDELYAALLDLFLVLKGRGRALRRRLLAGAGNLLGREQFAALSRMVEEGGLPPESELPPAPQSRLCEGVQGVFDLVGVRAQGAGRMRDPLQEARECIEYSQLDQAREILEAAVLEQPEREDLHHELLTLYRATRDGHSLSRMKERLQQLLGSLPAGWNDLGLPNGGGQPS